MKHVTVKPFEMKVGCKIVRWVVLEILALQLSFVCYRNEMVLFVLVAADDEKVFVHDSNVSIASDKLFLEVPLAVMVEIDDRFEQDFLFVKKNKK